MSSELPIAINLIAIILIIIFNFSGIKLGLAEAKVAIAEIIKTFNITCSSKTRRDNKLEIESFLLMLQGDIELIFEQL